MDSFVARQPIFDIRKKIYAYELLFRSGKTNAFPDIDGNTATSNVLSSSFFTVGIEKICSGHLAFINFPESLLLKGTPALFPKERLTVEILEDVRASKEVVEKCRELKKSGYQLALDDFVWSSDLTELLELADIIKFDVRLTPFDELERILPLVEKYNCRLLAEKIETEEEFQQAVKMGFDYFQGYFFAHPEILKNRELQGSQLGILRILSKINATEFDMDEIETLVSQDVAVSYKLLNYLNSARFSRITPVSSIRQAITFLGEQEFCTFITILATSCLNKNKPEELMRMSIIRARFLEQLGKATGSPKEELLLLGLFSLIDAMLDQKMEDIVSKLSLSHSLEEALVNKQGKLAPWLRLVESYERGNWVPFRFAQKRIAVNSEAITRTYLEAISWADNFSA
jgi:EAL and modified HD-GYP domain-containing signal transduction protein